MLVKRIPPKNDPITIPAIAPPLRALSVVGLGVSVAPVELSEIISEVGREAVSDAIGDAVLDGNEGSVVAATLSSVVDDVGFAEVLAAAAAHDGSLRICYQDTWKQAQVSIRTFWHPPVKLADAFRGLKVLSTVDPILRFYPQAVLVKVKHCHGSACGPFTG